MQRLEQIRSIGDAGNALCSRDGEAAFERGDGAGEPALFGGEELVAPVDRGAQRAMTFAAGAIARHQQREAIRKTGFDVVERESRASSGCELDRQRNPLEPAADPVDRRDRTGRDGRIHPLCARDEQLDGFTRAVAVQRERGKPKDVLAGEEQRLAARRNDDETGATAQECLREPRGLGQQMFRVVEDQ